MKRSVILLMSIFLGIICLAVPVSASESAPDLVVDYAQLISPEEEIALESSCKALGEAYQMDIVLVTIHSLSGQSAQSYADDYYDNNGYRDDGLFFLLAVDDREWYISTSGNAIYAVTDYGVQQLGEAAADHFSYGAYDLGFRAFLDNVEMYLEAYASGAPIDGYGDSDNGFYTGTREEVVYYENAPSPSLLLSVLIGASVAAVAIAVMRSSMNTKKAQRDASVYLIPGSFRLHTHSDVFLYSNVSKVRRQQNSSGGRSGGGSSVHRGSSGRRHGGGGGRF